jgi:hypothetical protein
LTLPTPRPVFAVCCCNICHVKPPLDAPLTKSLVADNPPADAASEAPLAEIVRRLLVKLLGAMR